MPKTNYKNCWRLIEAVTGDQGGYRNGTGYSIRNLVDLGVDGGVLGREVLYDYDNVRSRRIKEEFRQSLIRWRTIIYNEFGLAILMESTPGTVKGKGEGGYYYYLANPDLLDKNTTLREHIKFLADSEKERDDWVTVGKMAECFKGGSSSMGFLSSGGASSYGYLSKEGTSYRTVLGEENLEIIQFAMQFGEVLTIKYGKIRAGVDINAPYSLEPYQLKEIERRWYVIGNLYPLGHKESAEIAVYDLARLQFADEENPDVLYEPVKGFNIDDDKTLADICKINNRYLEGGYWLKNGVRTIDIMTHTEEFAKYLSDHPLCSAQEETSKGKYRIYTSLTTDTFVMFGAYGAELSFKVIRKDDNDLFPELIEIQLNFFRNTGE